MEINDIGAQLTPGTPTEITFAPNTNPPNPLRTVVIIGHAGASGTSASGSVLPYVSTTIVNVADPVACSGEIAPEFGPTSELTAMILSFVNSLQGGSSFPQIIAIPLASTDTDFGLALQTLDKLSCRFVVSPYDGNTSQVNSKALLAECSAMSAAGRACNNQFGTTAIAANQTTGNPAMLFKYDTQFGDFAWLPDSSGSIPQSIGVLAASYCAQLAQNAIPFNPVNGNILSNIAAPVKQSDWVSVGAGLESETCLQQGWSPLKVTPSEDVAVIRSRTLRVTVGGLGITAVTSYFDEQDFDVLYYWRQTIVNRFTQVDFTQAKNSAGTEDLALSELIRLADTFQTNGMFQNVAALAKQFIVQQNQTDPSRMDIFTPINVIPGLQVIATNISATTIGDTISV
jgi:phage tail sheath gpL-like